MPTVRRSPSVRLGAGLALAGACVAAPAAFPAAAFAESVCGGAKVAASDSTVTVGDKVTLRGECTGGGSASFVVDGQGIGSASANADGDVRKRFTAKRAGTLTVTMSTQNGQAVTRIEVADASDGGGDEGDGKENPGEGDGKENPGEGDGDENPTDPDPGAPGDDDDDNGGDEGDDDEDPTDPDPGAPGDDDEGDGGDEGDDNNPDNPGDDGDTPGDDDNPGDDGDGGDNGEDDPDDSDGGGDEDNDNPGDDGNDNGGDNDDGSEPPSEEQPPSDEPPSEEQPGDTGNDDGPVNAGPENPGKKPTKPGGPTQKQPPSNEPEQAPTKPFPGRTDADSGQRKSKPAPEASGRGKRMIDPSTTPNKSGTKAFPGEESERKPTVSAPVSARVGVAADLLARAFGGGGALGSESGSGTDAPESSDGGGELAATGANMHTAALLGSLALSSGAVTIWMQRRRTER